MIRYDGDMGAAGHVRSAARDVLSDPLEADTRSPRQWKRAIWEAETGRKHTLRRCDWRREQAVTP